jgi:hypothetical protein
MAKRFANSVVFTGAKWISSRSAPAIASAGFVIWLVVMWPVLQSARELTRVSNPALGWAETIYADALALQAGRLIPADPAHGATSMLYGPGFPAVLAGLGRIYAWSGWPILLTMCAVLILPPIIALSVSQLGAWSGTFTMPTRSATRWNVGAGSAFAIPALALLCLGRVPVNLLFDARSDHLAWTVAWAGAVLAIVGRQRRTWVLGAGGMAVGVALKPTSVSVLLGVCLGLLVTALIERQLRGARSGVLVPRQCSTVLVSSAGAVASLLLMDILLFHGWATRGVLTASANHEKVNSIHSLVTQLAMHEWMGLAPLALVFVVLILGLVIRGRSRRESVLFALTPAVVPVTTLGVTVAATGAAWAKQGGDSNQVLGAIWALTFGVMLLSRRSTIGMRTVAVGIAIIIAGAAVLAPRVPVIANAQAKLGPLALGPLGEARFSDGGARVRTAFDQSPFEAATIEGGPLLPNQFNIVDQLAAGFGPNWIIHAVADKRAAYGSDLDVSGDAYASAFGSRAFGSLWAINQVEQQGLPIEYARATCGGDIQLGGVMFIPTAVPSLWCNMDGARAHLVYSAGVAWLRIADDQRDATIRVSGADRILVADPALPAVGTTEYSDSVAPALEVACERIRGVPGAEYSILADQTRIDTCSEARIRRLVGVVGAGAEVSILNPSKP